MAYQQPGSTWCKTAHIDACAYKMPFCFCHHTPCATRETERDDWERVMVFNTKEENVLSKR